MPKVSICIPTYEQPENLKKCLESIELQSFKNFEVIITDDSKSDNLVSIVNAFKNKINIKYYKNSPAKGSPENWNESLKYAKGKYIKILHHDDYFTFNDSLEKMVKLLDGNPKNKILFCSSKHVNSDFKYHSSHILNHQNMEKIKYNPNILFFGNLIGAPSVMMYHNGINLDFDQRMKWLVDIDFYIRILKENNFTYTTEELISINLGEENRVTYQCENDKEVNLYEHMILFEKLNLQKIPFHFKFFFIVLYLKFDIKAYNEIDKFNVNCYGNDFKQIFAIVGLLRPIYKFYKRFKHVIK